MLSIHNLTKKFPRKQSWFKQKEPDFTAVNSISFAIKEGEAVGLLGPNGAGKTTTLYMLLDILTPTSGSIYYFGKELPIYRSEIMQHVAFGSAYTNLPSRLTVRENLEIFGRLYSVPRNDLTQRIKEYLELFGIANRAHQETGTLSAGQKTRVMLAKTFLVHPKMVILDEPTSSLDPDIALEVRALIIKLQKEYGLTVLLASHNMDEVATICNRVIVLSQGTIIADNTPEILAKSVANSTVHLVVTARIQELIAYLLQAGYNYKLIEPVIEITMDEHKISDLLVTLAKLDVQYSTITIQKPTLENYFLEIARASRNKTELI